MYILINKNFTSISACKLIYVNKLIKKLNSAKVEFFLYDCFNICKFNFNPLFRQSLEKEIEKVQNELRTCRQNLNEEKSFKLRAEQRVSILEHEVANKDDSIFSLEKNLKDSGALVENLKLQVLK